MLKRSTFEQLRLADPAPIATARAVATAIDLRGRVFSAVAWQDTGDQSESLSKPTRRRPLRLRTVVFAVAAALVMVLVVAPAFGIIRGVLPFYGAPKAPQQVQVEFNSMNTGAPAGMSPQAIPGETRDIGQFTFGGASHTLWVAPTAAGGFCFEWIGGWGGCTAPNPDPLTWNGNLTVPSGVSTPTIPPPQARPVDNNALAAALMKMRSLAVPTWISGYVNAADAHEVVIKFSDGTTVHPAVIWVSKPIDAGFFSYSIPTRYQTESNHLVAVDAFSASGTLVDEQPLRR
jgi:hypothetical protein